MYFMNSKNFRSVNHYQLVITVIANQQQWQMSINPGQKQAQMASLLHQFSAISLGSLGETSKSDLLDMKCLQGSIPNQQESSQFFESLLGNEPLEDSDVFFERTNQYRPLDDIKCFISCYEWSPTYQKYKEKLFKRNRMKQKQEIACLAKESEAIQASVQRNYLTRSSANLATQRRQNQRQLLYKLSKKEIRLHVAHNQIETLMFRGEDIQKLKPDEDLNDTIIENYIKIIKLLFIPKQLSFKIHFFSTFFFVKLIGQNMITKFAEEPYQLFKNQVEKIKEKVRENYNNVKRWTKNTDIFEKELLIFPINAFSHWFCVLVLNPRNIALEIGVERSAQIIYCDSMFEKRDFITQSIKQYLRLELEDKKRKLVKPFQQNVYSYQLLLPRQTNTHDCGLYMLAYIDQLLNHRYHRLKTFKSLENRNQLNLFPRKLIATMRQRLLRLIESLSSANNSQNVYQISRQFCQEKEEILSKGATFDEINEQQYKKQKALIAYMISKATLQSQQFEISNIIRFYLDPIINYYEKDNQIQ